MKKIDCSKTVNYMRERVRLTKSCSIDCKRCPLFSQNNGTGELCGSFELMYPEKVIEIVQKWSDEHPRKTYKDDFLEKFPKAPLDSSGCPFVSPCHLYDKMLHCSESAQCRRCWDKVMEE